MAKHKMLSVLIVFWLLLVLVVNQIRKRLVPKS
jgi:hypothetical protein